MIKFNRELFRTPLTIICAHNTLLTCIMDIDYLDRKQIITRGIRLRANASGLCSELDVKFHSFKFENAVSALRYLPQLVRSSLVHVLTTLYDILV